MDVVSAGTKARINAAAFMIDGFCIFFDLKLVFLFLAPQALSDCSILTQLSCGKRVSERG